MKRIILLQLILSMALMFTVQSCQKKKGCTNPLSENYDINADEDDGSCIIRGCTNITSENYNQNATVDDGSCIIKGCNNPEAINYNTEATDDDGSCTFRKDLYIGTFVGSTECDNDLLNNEIGGKEIIFTIIEIPGENNKVTVKVDFNIDLLQQEPVASIDENNVLTFQGEQKNTEVVVLGTPQIFDIYMNGTFTLDEATKNILSGTIEVDARLSSTPDMPFLVSSCEATALRQ